MPYTNAITGTCAEPSRDQVEAAAEAWMSWQFPGRQWSDTVPALKDRFREGAKLALMAANSVGPVSGYAS